MVLVQGYDIKRRMFANTFCTQFRVDWRWGKIQVREIKEGVIKSLKPWKLGEESGQLHGFFLESVELGDELGCRYDERKELRFELGKRGKIIVPFRKTGKVVRKSNFQGENDEFGNDFLYLINTFVTLIMYLALY